MPLFPHLLIRLSSMKAYFSTKSLRYFSFHHANISSGESSGKESVTLLLSISPFTQFQTMVDLSRNITAKRIFKRAQPEPAGEKTTENGMSKMEEESNAFLNEGAVVDDGESFNNETQALSSDRQEIVLEAGNATDGFWQDGWEDGIENGTLAENGKGNIENEDAIGSEETHKERETVLQENRDSINSTAGEQEGNKNNNGMTNSDGIDKFPPTPESNFEVFENVTVLEGERANTTDLFTAQNSNNQTIDNIDNDERRK